MKIAMDLDGVVFNWVEAFIDYTNAKYGYADDSYEFTQWSFFMQEDVELNEEQFVESYKEFNDYRMWQGLEIYPNVKNSLCALHSMGHEIIYLTHRIAGSEMSTLKSLVHNGLPINGILFERDKARVAKELGCKIGVDDKPQTLIEYNKAGILPVKMKHKYNLEKVANEIEITNMEHLIDIVKRGS